MISEIYAVIPGIVIMTIVLIINYRKKVTLLHAVLTALFILYITGVICVTLFPINYSDKVSPGFNIMIDKLKLIPFEVITKMFTQYGLFVSLVQVGGNILMTFPLGVMLPFVMPDRKKIFYPLCFLMFTFAIEATQFLLGYVLNTFYRTADIDDIILNFTGAMLGYLLYKIIPDKIKQKLK